MYRIAHGDIDGAIDDKLTLYRLGRQITQKSFLVQYLVGCAIEGSAATIPVNGTSEHQATKEQIQRVLDGLATLPPRGLLHDSYEMERLMGLSVLQDVRLGRPLMDFLRVVDVERKNEGEVERKSDPSDIFLRAYIASCDWNVVYRRIHEVYDALQELPPQEFDAMIREIEIQVQRDLFFRTFTATGRGTTFANMFATLFLPAVMAADAARQRIECTENLQRLTLALLLYEKEHGSLPDGDWREALQKPPLPLGEGWGEGGGTSDMSSPHPNPLPEGEGTGKLPVGEGIRLTGVPEKYFRCPSHPGLAEDETIYAMVGGVPNAVPSPTQILLVELREPQKLGEGDGRIPFEQAKYGNHPNEPRPLESALGSNHAGGITIGVRSGAVRFISQTIHSDVWQSLLDGTADALP